MGRQELYSEVNVPTQENMSVNFMFSYSFYTTNLTCFASTNINNSF